MRIGNQKLVADFFVLRNKKVKKRIVGKKHRKELNEVSAGISATGRTLSTG